MIIYKISYSLFPVDGGVHLSNCRSSVEATSYEKALEKLKVEKLEQGWIVAFAVEGDMFEVTFEDKS